MTHLAAAPTYPSGSIWHTHLRQISWIHGQGPVTLSARRHEGARCCNVMMPKAAQMEQQEGAPSQRFCATLPQMPKSCLPRLNPPPKPHMKWLRHRRVVSKAQLNLNLPKSCAPCARHAALTFYSLFFSLNFLCLFTERQSSHTTRALACNHRHHVGPAPLHPHPLLRLLSHHGGVDIHVRESYIFLHDMDQPCILSPSSRTPFIRRPRHPRHLLAHPLPRLPPTRRRRAQSRRGLQARRAQLFAHPGCAQAGKDAGAGPVQRPCLSGL